MLEGQITFGNALENGFEIVKETQAKQDNILQNMNKIE